MRRFRSGWRGKAWVILMVALVAIALPYAVVMLPGPAAGLGVALVVSLLLALLWALARVNHLKEELRGRALRDSLTGLPNRSWFVDRVDRVLDRPVVVLLVDLDDFEEVNHGLGQETADRVLIVTAGRIGACVRPDGGELARLCSDEFAVLLENVPDEVSATRVADRIGEALKAPIELEGTEVLVSASIGVVVGRPGQGNTPEGLLRRADVAMHAAKREGKARRKIFDPGGATTTSGRLLKEADLRRAIEERELRVHYQPMVSLEDGEVRGMEALLRWRHPTYGLIPPDEFVPVAEETGLILPIGRWVLEEACRSARSWQQERSGAQPLMVSVNVSARQFREPDLAGTVVRVLERTGLRPRHLKLEITESVMVHHAVAASTLRELKSFGVGLAMDDFGTGYSNLSYVKRLPLDHLKIDRSYVKGLGKNAEDTAIVHATVAFAKALGLNLIAEGVEDAGQAARLKELGCELGQGYYFARPLPGEEVRAFLDAYPSKGPESSATAGPVGS